MNFRLFRFLSWRKGKKGGKRLSSRDRLPENKLNTYFSPFQTATKPPRQSPFPKQRRKRFLDKLRKRVRCQKNIIVDAPDQLELPALLCQFSIPFFCFCFTFSAAALLPLPGSSPRRTSLTAAVFAEETPAKRESRAKPGEKEIFQLLALVRQPEAPLTETNLKQAQAFLAKYPNSLQNDILHERIILYALQDMSDDSLRARLDRVALSSLKDLLDRPLLPLDTSNIRSLLSQFAASSSSSQHLEELVSLTRLLMKGEPELGKENLALCLALFAIPSASAGLSSLEKDFLLQACLLPPSALRHSPLPQQITKQAATIARSGKHPKLLLRLSNQLAKAKQTRLALHLSDALASGLAAGEFKTRVVQFQRIWSPSRANQAKLAILVEIDRRLETRRASVLKSIDRKKLARSLELPWPLPHPKNPIVDLQEKAEKEAQVATGKEFPESLDKQIQSDADKYFRQVPLGSKVVVHPKIGRREISGVYYQRYPNRIRIAGEILNIDDLQPQERIWFDPRFCEREKKKYLARQSVELERKRKSFYKKYKERRETELLRGEGYMQIDGKWENPSNLFAEQLKKRQEQLTRELRHQLEIQLFRANNFRLTNHGWEPIVPSL